ncbi:MAG: hypothetical protein WKF89_09660 [Chitinophagaceae bacterium]
MIVLLKTKKMMWLGLIIVMCSSYTIVYNSSGKMGRAEVDPPGQKTKDSIASRQAFLMAYKVLMSPRCMNCHPAGDVPLQGEDSHLHTMGVKRGKDGHGIYAMKCTNCHQPANIPGLHTPPGNPKWALPPADMKMVFEGKTPRQLALQLKDSSLNGGKTMQQIVDHISHDTLVLAGWHPAEGLALPPMSHKEFAKNFKKWVDKGAVVPAE